MPFKERSSYHPFLGYQIAAEYYIFVASDNLFDFFSEFIDLVT